MTLSQDLFARWREPPKQEKQKSEAPRKEPPKVQPNYQQENTRSNPQSQSTHQQNYTRSESKFCTECGYRLSGGKFCRECGHPVSGSTRNGKSKVESERKESWETKDKDHSLTFDHKKIAWIPIGIGLLLVVFGVSSNNEVLGGLGFWTIILGAAFRQFGGVMVKNNIPLWSFPATALGLLGLVILFVGMASDTTVATGTSFGRVHNIGLMRQQENTMMLGGLLFVAGLVVGGFFYVKNK